MGIKNKYKDFDNFLVDLSGEDSTEEKSAPESRATTASGETPLPNHTIKRVCGTCKYFYRPAAVTGTTLSGKCAALVWSKAKTKQERSKIDPDTLPPTMLFTCCSLHDYHRKGRILGYTNKANIPPSARER